MHMQGQSTATDNHGVGVAAATRAARKAGADAQDAATSLLMLRELPYVKVLCRVTSMLFRDLKSMSEVLESLAADNFSSISDVFFKSCSSCDMALHSTCA